MKRKIRLTGYETGSIYNLDVSYIVFMQQHWVGLSEFTVISLNHDEIKTMVVHETVEEICDLILDAYHYSFGV